jgi:hypothetical protein
MGIPIDLDNDPFFTAAKIHDISANRVLATEFESAQCPISQA